MNPERWKQCAAEAVGSFAITFIAAGAVCANRYSGGELGLLGIALAYAAATAAMTSSTVAASGGHLNPAITLAASVCGRIPPATAVLYVTSQLAGAAAAGFALAGLYSPEVWAPVNLGTPTLSPEVAFATGTFLEAVMSFFLVFAALQMAAIGPPTDIVYGLTIGLVLLGDALAGGSLTGAAVNPARAFGPALASGIWQDHLVYWVGPIIGGLAAAVAHRLLQPAETD